LNRYKEKGNIQVKEYIWEIQEVYYNTTKDITQPTSSDKGKQQEDVVQEKVFLYKPYNTPYDTTLE